MLLPLGSILAPLACLLAPFWTWHSLFVQRKRISKTISRVLREWKFQVLHVPFSTWRESACQQVQETRAVRKIVVRWRRLELSTPFHTWTLRASEQKRQKIGAGKAILRWKLKLHESKLNLYLLLINTPRALSAKVFWGYVWQVFGSI